MAFSMVTTWPKRLGRKSQSGGGAQDARELWIPVAQKPPPPQIHAKGASYTANSHRLNRLWSHSPDSTHLLHRGLHDIGAQRQDLAAGLRRERPQRPSQTLGADPKRRGSDPNQSLWF